MPTLTAEQTELIDLAQYVLMNLANLLLEQSDWPDVTLKLVVSHA